MKGDVLDKLAMEMVYSDGDDDLDLDKNATLAQHVNFFRNASIE